MNASGMASMFERQVKDLASAQEAFEQVGKEVLDEAEYKALDEYIAMCTVAWGAMAKCAKEVADREAKQKADKKAAEAKKKEKPAEDKKSENKKSAQNDLSFLD